MLVNNAGILKDVLSRWRTPELSADGIEIHWRTNYLGTFHLTSLLLPMLIESGRASGDARVLNVTSHQHARGRNERLFATTHRYNSWDAYGQSKTSAHSHDHGTPSAPRWNWRVPCGGVASRVCAHQDDRAGAGVLWISSLTVVE